MKQCQCTAAGEIASVGVFNIVKSRSKPAICFANLRIKPKQDGELLQLDFKHNVTTEFKATLCIDRICLFCDAS